MITSDEYLLFSPSFLILLLLFANLKIYVIALQKLYLKRRNIQYIILYLLAYFAFIIFYRQII